MKRAAGFLRRLTRCLATDAWIVAEMAAWRIGLPALKRTINITTLARMMWSPPAAPIDARLKIQRLSNIKHMMSTGGRLLVSANCLERSLLFYRLLSRADANPTLMLGAATEGATLAGHAWIELDGEPLGERDAAKYAVVLAFGRDGRAYHGSELQGLA